MLRLALVLSALLALAWPSQACHRTRHREHSRSRTTIAAVGCGSCGQSTAAPQTLPMPTALPATGPGSPASQGEAAALADVNRQRAARGLPPYQFDAGLTAGAVACASYRARMRISGHVTGGMGDFGFLPSGVSASAGGCAAWPTSMPFGACAMFDRYRLAGAATVRGADGVNYHHLFVR